MSAEDQGHPELSGEPVLELKAYRKTDPFSQITGGNHFRIAVNPIDVTGENVLTILADALRDAGETLLAKVDCTGKPAKEQERQSLLKVLALPAETLSAAMTARFMRTNDTQEDQ